MYVKIIIKCCELVGHFHLNIYPGTISSALYCSIYTIYLLRENHTSCFHVFSIFSLVFAREAMRIPPLISIGISLKRSASLWKRRHRDVCCLYGQPKNGSMTAECSGKSISKFLLHVTSSVFNCVYYIVFQWITF